VKIVTGSAIVFLLLFSLLSCVPLLEVGDRKIEDGVEIVFNQLEPFKDKRKPVSVRLEEKFTLDFARDDIVDLGITDVRDFDVDSSGNIYVANFTKEAGDCIYKFDKSGNFLASFAPKGHGQGELYFPRSLHVDHRDLIKTLSRARGKLITYAKDGRFISEIKMKKGIFDIVSLKNGTYVVAEFAERYKTLFYFMIILSLYSQDLEHTRELEKVKIPNRPSPSYWVASNKNIYVGNEERGYEIWVYSLEGNLIRKIKKEFIPEKIPKKKREKMEKAYEMVQQQAQFPERHVTPPTHWPPFMSFFVSEKDEKLFVQTFEEGEKSLCMTFSTREEFLSEK
jgi:hypothetical protein